MGIRSIQSTTNPLPPIVSNLDHEPEDLSAQQELGESSVPASPGPAPLPAAERGRRIHESGLQATSLRASLEQQLSRNVSQRQKEHNSAGEFQTPGIIKTVLQTGQEVVSAGLQVREKALGRIDAKIQNEVDKLNKGDDLKVGVGSFVQAELRGESTEQVLVTRTGNGEKPYDVKASVDVGLGFVVQGGGSAGAKAKLEGTGVVKAGGAYIYSFENSAQAAKAVRIHGQASAVTMASDKLPRGTEYLLGPANEDYAFLTDHLKAVELSAGSAGKVAAKFGFETDGKNLKVGGLNLQFNGEVRRGARIDLPQDGNPARVSFFVDGMVSLGGSAAAGIKTTSKDPSGMSTGVGASVSQKWQFRAEQSYDLPASIDVDALKKDPLKTLSDISMQVDQSEEISVKLTNQAQGAWQFRSSGGLGSAQEIKMTGRPADLAKPLEKIWEGKFVEGIRDASSTVHVSGRSSMVETSGKKLNLELTFVGLGVGGEMVCERTSRKTQAEFDGTPTDAANWILKNASQHSQNPGIPQPAGHRSSQAAE